MDFAVTEEGVDKPGSGRWVLAVDGDKLLLTGADKTPQWVAMAKCKVAKVGSPDYPRPVFPASPPKRGPTLAVATGPTLVKPPGNGS